MIFFLIYIYIYIFIPDSVSYTFIFLSIPTAIYNNNILYNSIYLLFLLLVIIKNLLYIIINNKIYIYKKYILIKLNYYII